MNKRPSFADIENFLNTHYKKLAGGIYKEWLHWTWVWQTHAYQDISFLEVDRVGGFEVK